MFKFTYNLAMTSFNVYVHGFINCYEYLAPPKSYNFTFLLTQCTSKSAPLFSATCAWNFYLIH